MGVWGSQGIHQHSYGGSHRRDRLGPIRVDLRVWNKWSIEIPEALAVVREVFIVLI